MGGIKEKPPGQDLENTSDQVDQGEDIKPLRICGQSTKGYFMISQWFLSEKEYDKKVKLSNNIITNLLYYFRLLQIEIWH